MGHKASWGLFLAGALCAGSAWAQDGTAPLSVIPWLSETLDRTDPVAAAPSAPVAVTPLPDRDGITVVPLGAPDRAATGLISAQRAGLPSDLWQGTDPTDLANLLRSMPVHSQPALQEAFSRLILTEAAPPKGARDALLLARIDALLIRGALEPAQALLERAGPDTPDLFRRWFDILLLSGTEDRACATLAAKPELSPNYETRVFCLARSGRWHTAALTLETATALGRVTPDMRDRLARFLDPDIFEGEPMPPLPDPITPLDFRLLEAVGEPVPTSRLPLAFAQTDLRHIIGWKSQIEAAERLTRSGALATNRLLGIYTARQPAASGGVWDRVAAVQALDIAITAGHPDVVAARLPAAIEAMRAAGLEAVLDDLFGARLARLDLPPQSAQIAHAMALIAQAPTRLPINALPTRLAFATALARGENPQGAGGGVLGAALRDGLMRDDVPERYAPLVARKRWGEALLRALDTLSTGALTDPQDAGDAIALMAQVGLDDLARQAAVQILLLDPTP
ncbi:hypothetical protein [Meridianimarinicoccus aquatilis]|uniref:Antifreeze glycopeptide polyprotein n=1 Tax=Meridianimarinicoccus aquatilis TaxID=2552766 RepID=A0A4R6B3T4_9RHOB|nr:hypothetical protein [Fluviibacterium aquatile]TDL90985.1 hypothetical protein E2L05_03000 [Fluviibacterium aquatile]